MILYASKKHGQKRSLTFQDYIVDLTVRNSKSKWGQAGVFIYRRFIYPHFNLCKAGVDVLSILEQEIHKYSIQGKIILLGDFNARTGTLYDFIENHCHDFLTTDDAHNLDKNWPKRNNGDHTVNKLGGKILRLCIGNKLRILNGRVTGGLDSKLTSYQSNGASTVD